MRGLVSLLFLLVACDACAPYATVSHGRDGYPPSTFTSVGHVNVKASVYDAKRGKNVPYGWSGTGWSFSVDNGRSLIVTAGHVCPNDGQKIDDGVLVSSQVTFDDYYGKTFQTVEIIDDEDVDVCLLLVEGVVRPLDLALGQPSIGQPVSYVGYPANDFSIVDGRWVGMRKDRLLMATLETVPGASGSPVLNSAGDVVGMVVRYNADFNEGARLVSLSTLKRILKMVGR